MTNVFYISVFVTLLYWHEGPQAVELRGYFGVGSEGVAFEQAALAVAHEKGRYLILHQFLGHRVLVGVEAHEQNAYVCGVVHELGEAGRQRFANGAVFGSELTKHLQVLVDKAAQVFVIGIYNVLAFFFSHNKSKGY